ncbi:MAG: amidohydrolase family protein [Lachnospiraceae bacterium]|nr:amidohydrolase family protein [Lachnospiraceae bacterium]
MIYDAHIHNKNIESGGFIIGLEGERKFEGVLNNEKALALHSPEDYYITFYYVTKEQCMIDENIGHSYLKYHPRREHYSVEQVAKSINKNLPKAVIIDTLNEPYWVAYDYWKIAKLFPEILFIFAHSGGYLINDFIKICHFQPNVWIDFSFTQTILGHYGNKENGLPYIEQAIKYALKSSFRNKILFSSDYPFCNQEDVFKYYFSYIDQLNDNFLSIFTKIK